MAAKYGRSTTYFDDPQTQTVDELLGVLGLVNIRDTFRDRIIIGSDRRPETKQRIKGKIDKFRSGRVRVRYN